MLENFPSISFNSRFKNRDGSRKKNSPFEKSNFTFKKMENRREASKTVERKGKEKNLTLKKLNFWNIVSTFHRFIVLPIFPPPLPSPLLPLSLFRWLIVVDEFMGLGSSNTTAKHEVTLLNLCRRAILAVDRPTQAEIQAGFRLRIESEPKILGVFVCSRLGFGIKTENDRWLTVIPCCFCVNVHLYINGWYISISLILLLAHICWSIYNYIYIRIYVYIWGTT